MNLWAVVKETNNRYEFAKLHDNIREAREEAERLCRKEDATFYVFKMIGKCYKEKSPIVWRI